MRVEFLGTGTSQGVPVIACDCVVCRSTDPRDQRLRCSVLIEHRGRVIVIDTGPDFRTQMLRARVRHLDAVLYTHRHKDHVAGLDDIRSFNFRQRQPMPLFGDVDTLAAIRQEFSYIFSGEQYPGIPQVELYPIDDQPFELFDFEVIPIPVLHYRMPVLGFRIDNFAYVTDANYIPPESMRRLEGVEVLVLNALRHEPHLSHFTLAEAQAIVQFLQPRAAYFTHISHLLGLHEATEAHLHANESLAYDGLIIEI